MSQNPNRFRYSKLIRLKSSDKNASSTSNTNFTVNFNNINDLQNVRAVSIKSISFPNLVYNVPSAWTLNYTDDVAGAQSTTISAGQYSLNELIAIIKAGIDADISPKTMTIALSSSGTKKLTYAVSAGS
jgi:hypothetical protein